MTDTFVKLLREMRTESTQAEERRAALREDEMRKSEAIKAESHFKSLTSDEFLDDIYRVLKGLFNSCTCIDEVMYVLARCVVRQYLPREARIFLEAQKITKRLELRDALGSWLATRQPGNFFFPVGSYPRDYNRPMFNRDGNKDGILTCFRCGKVTK